MNSFLFQEFVTHEARLFKNLPFTQFTLKGQDKKENFFKVLGIDMEETPYFPHLIFYICLAIIKKNNFDATQDRKQNQDFIQLMQYIKLHYQDLLKTILSPIYNRFSPQFQEIVDRSGLRPKFDIPSRFGLYRGKVELVKECAAKGRPFSRKLCKIPNFRQNMYLHRIKIYWIYVS